MTTARTIKVWLPEASWVAAMGGLPDGMTADVWTGGERVRGGRAPAGGGGGGGGGVGG